MKHETPALGTHTWDKVRLGGGRLICWQRRKSPEQGFGPWKSLREHTSRGHSGHLAEDGPLQGWPPPPPQGGRPCEVCVLPGPLLPQVKEGSSHPKRRQMWGVALVICVSHPSLAFPEPLT